MLYAVFEVSYIVCMLFKKYFPDFVYGGMDGLITTFAIITGAVGAELGVNVVIIIGIASIFSDAFSMGASKFVSQRSACRIGSSVCEPHEPLKTAFSTFISFFLIGFVPVVPFVLRLEHAFTWSLTLTFILFFFIGFVEGYLSDRSRLLTGLGTLLIGAVAAMLSYGVGHFLAGVV